MVVVLVYWLRVHIYAGEAVVWYGGQFYALFFLTQTLKVPYVTAWT